MGSVLKQVFVVSGCAACNTRVLIEGVSRWPPSRWSGSRCQSIPPAHAIPFCRKCPCFWALRVSLSFREHPYPLLSLPQAKPIDLRLAVWMCQSRWQGTQSVLVLHWYGDRGLVINSGEFQSASPAVHV